MQIEVTSWCNLQCAGCPRTIEINQSRWENNHMQMDVFKTIVDTMPVSETLCMQGVGESTLHPQFPEMIAYAKQSGKYGGITLNTNLLARPPDYYRTLKEAGLGHVSVSVDSFDQEIAEACRKGTIASKLFDRLKALRTIYEPLPLTISIVASKRNLHDIPKTLRILNELGIFIVEIQALIIFDPDAGDQGNASVELDKNDMQTLKNYVDGPYSNLSIMFALSDNMGRDIRCRRPFLAPYITAQGYLTPCCTIEDPGVLGYTKIDGRPFEDIWQDPPVQAWLHSYMERVAPEICKGCCFYTG